MSRDDAAHGRCRGALDCASDEFGERVWRVRAKSMGETHANRPYKGFKRPRLTRDVHSTRHAGLWTSAFVTAQPADHMRSFPPLPSPPVRPVGKALS